MSRALSGGRADDVYLDFLAAKDGFDEACKRPDIYDPITASGRQAHRQRLSPPMTQATRLTPRPRPQMGQMTRLLGLRR